MTRSTRPRNPSRLDRVQLAAAFRILFHLRTRRAHRPRRDVADADARRCLRRIDDRRVDRLAQERISRHRSLCARLDRTFRRTAGRIGRWGDVLGARRRHREVFDGRCDYLISGITPQARYWTVTLYDPDGRLVANAIDRQDFTSQEIVRQADGRFEITISRARARATGCRPAASIVSSCCGGSTTRRSASRREPQKKGRCLRSFERAARDPLDTLDS